MDKKILVFGIVVIQNFIDTISKPYNNQVGLPRFELEFLAPKAKRMDQATPQALCRFGG